MGGIYEKREDKNEMYWIDPWYPCNNNRYGILISPDAFLGDLMVILGLCCGITFDACVLSDA